ncbi:hypothetical protein NWE61_06735 [Mycoplasmopsis felis]|uniref:hypothetical protein n=1 Tax=Mycoplasmopsis felis TaxID=33923 RepID=UPI0021DFED93|nr:hypothetical protein [Mycoplasmopsis felis]MCU9934740.1 hypothetical protein [Mycoplasmopsis felis]
MHPEVLAKLEEPFLNSTTASFINTVYDTINKKYRGLQIITISLFPEKEFTQGKKVAVLFDKNSIVAYGLNFIIESYPYKDMFKDQINTYIRTRGEIKLVDPHVHKMFCRNKTIVKDKEWRVFYFFHSFFDYMYPNELIYLWLDQLKQNLAIADNLRDNVLLDYIEVARENIWLQYYELDFKNGEIPEDHPWAWDKKTMLATLHLAATYFMNPDITQRGNNIYRRENDL